MTHRGRLGVDSKVAMRKGWVHTSEQCRCDLIGAVVRSSAHVEILGGHGVQEVQLIVIHGPEVLSVFQGILEASTRQLAFVTGSRPHQTSEGMICRVGDLVL